MKLQMKEWIEIHNSLQQLVGQDLPFQLMWDISEFYDNVDQIVNKFVNQLRETAVKKFDADQHFKIPDSKYPEYQKYEQEAMSTMVDVTVPEMKREQFADVKAKYLTSGFRKLIS